jgi:hypothetical protein
MTSGHGAFSLGLSISARIADAMPLPSGLRHEQVNVVFRTKKSNG